MNLFDSSYALFLLLIFAGIGVSLIYEKKAHISPTPVLPIVRRKAMDLLKNMDISAREIVDLGSGWGGMSLKLANTYPNAHVTGYEISPVPYGFSRLRTLFSKQITITREDFFKKDLGNADIVTCYLSPYHMEKLKSGLADLKKGSVVVSCSFPIEGWEAERTETVRGIFVEIPVYLYVIK